MNTKNYKNKRREAKKICRAKTKDPMTLKMLEGMEEANKNAARKSYTIARGMKAGFQPRTSIYKERDNNLTENDRFIMERRKEYFL
jgi:hypothetical protein